jgi:CelD/BcsL family acetyltransferase involved in cellulose biosynthesis
VHRERDVDLRHMSLLDDPLESAFYDALLHRHLEALELFELRLQEELSAYVLWIRNGAARLVLDNRVSPRFKHYSAGLIANNVALRTAAADPAITVLDWGTGSQRYKLQSANKVIPHVDLVAWSSRAVRSALTARRLLGPSRPR